MPAHRPDAPAQLAALQPALPLVDLRAQYHRLKESVDAAIAGVLAHGQYVLGPEVGELERQLSALVGARHCVTCASGTQALAIAMIALRIGPGDEVITSAFSFVAAAEMVALLGATPAFVDIEADSFNLDPEQLEAAISPRTRLILPVSLFGQPFEADAVGEIASRHRLPVLEDAAQSLGATYKSRHSGHLSHIGATSFYPTKPLGCYGDGGALFTDDDELADLFRSLRMHGMGEARYHHVRLGVNGRLDTLQAAVLLAKLEAFHSEIRARQLAAARYTDLLRDVDGLTAPVVKDGTASAWAHYTVMVDNRERVREHMQREGVETEVYYPIPLHRQPALAGLARISGKLAHSEQAARTALSLPIGPDISFTQQQRVVEALRAIARTGATRGRPEEA